MRGTLNDLTAFVAVALERSFTRAAAQLGLSREMLSYFGCTSFPFEHHELD